MFTRRRGIISFHKEITPFPIQEQVVLEITDENLFYEPISHLTFYYELTDPNNNLQYPAVKVYISDGTKNSSGNYRWYNIGGSSYYVLQPKNSRESTDLISPTGDKRAIIVAKGLRIVLFEAGSNSNNQNTSIRFSLLI